MKQTKSNSYNSTPFSSKENVCPNAKFNTLNCQKKKHLTPSMGTDPQFSIFNTINVNRRSQPNSMTTKSRVEMQAIIQDFSNSQQKSTKECPYSHKSFLALLGLTIGREDFSMQEAIQKCQEYEISCRDQLLNILQSKQPTREWPLPLSNLLLTDLGQLKIMQICSKLENQEDLSDNELEILQFLLPKDHCLETIDKGMVLECYHDFKNKIAEKFNLVDNLVKQYSLRIQPKIRKIQDKILLIKIQKRLRRFQKLHKKHINYTQMKSCLEGLGLTQEETLVLFRYLYFIQNDKVMELVDRKEMVELETCIKEILDKTEIPFAKQTISRIELIGSENVQVINDLLADKTHLLERMDSKDQQMLRLNNCVTLLKLRLENQIQQSQKQKQRELQSLKIKYLNRIKKLEMQNNEKDNIIEWYKNELTAAVEANQAEIISKQKPYIYRQVYKHQDNRKFDNMDCTEDKTI